MNERERMRALVRQLADTACELSDAWLSCDDATSDALTRAYPAGVPCLYELASALVHWRSQLDDEVKQ
jgi:folate-dependent phosphoribosylglycinamide formyltransferase PurN